MTSDPIARIPIFGNVRVKYIALVLLVIQTVGAIITLRMSRLVVDNVGFKYLNTTAVFVSELLKVAGSLFLVWRDTSYSFQEAKKQIYSTIVRQPFETLKVGIPAFLYTVQNNLIFIALSNMSPAVYQVTYQLKILTTAFLSVLILNKRLSVVKWISLFILATGVACIQIPTEQGIVKPVQGNFLVGVTAVLCACMTSGFAGVYFEKILKGSQISIWNRNIQLAIFGSILALLGAYWNDGNAIATNGFFQGYTTYTWIAIFFQSAGGLIVAAVLKYADNILKCFGNAIAIVTSCVASYFVLGDFVLSIFFAIGTIFVIISTYVYGTEFSLTGSFLGNLWRGKYSAVEIDVEQQHTEIHPSLRLSIDPPLSTQMSFHNI